MGMKGESGEGVERLGSGHSRITPHSAVVQPSLSPSFLPSFYELLHPSSHLAM